MSQHEYLRRMNLALALGVVDAGSAALANVYHDDDCPYLDEGVCSCDPEIRIDTDKGPVWVASDGTVTTEGPEP